MNGIMVRSLKDVERLVGRPCVVWVVESVREGASETPPAAVQRELGGIGKRPPSQRERP